MFARCSGGRYAGTLLLLLVGVVSKGKDYVLELVMGILLKVGRGNFPKARVGGERARRALLRSRGLTLGLRGLGGRAFVWVGGDGARCGD